MSADTIGDAVGLTMNDRDAAIIDTEPLGANLRHYGLEPLPQGRPARHELDRTRNIHAEAHAVLGTQPGLFDETGQARTHQFPVRATAALFALQAVPSHRRQGLVEQPGVIAGI